jgi:hypothetical protein
MRRLTLALVGVMLFCAATVVRAADSASAPASQQPSFTLVTPPVDLLFASSQPNSSQSPSALHCITTVPVTRCMSCFYLGELTTYGCTTFCANGVLQSSCTRCGEGCYL